MSVAGVEEENTAIIKAHGPVKMTSCINFRSKSC